MAAITSADVTKLQGYAEGDRTGKWVADVRRLKIVLSAQGGTAADIPASALGFAEIYSGYAYAFDDATNVRGAWIGVALDGSEIFPVDGVEATDADRTLRSNLTGDLYVVLRGRASA